MHQLKVWYMLELDNNLYTRMWVSSSNWYTVQLTRWQQICLPNQYSQQHSVNNTDNMMDQMNTHDIDDIDDIRIEIE